MRKQTGIEGEGSYTASKQYNDATKKFVKSGRVEEAARRAAPQSPEESQALVDAEQKALVMARAPKSGALELESLAPPSSSTSYATKRRRGRNPLTE